MIEAASTLLPEPGAAFTHSEALSPEVSHLENTGSSNIHWAVPICLEERCRSRSGSGLILEIRPPAIHLFTSSWLTMEENVSYFAAQILAVSTHYSQIPDNLVAEEKLAVRGHWPNLELEETGSC